MTTGTIEVTVGRGGKADEYKEYKDGKLISTTYKKRYGSQRRPTPAPEEEVIKKQTIEEHEESQSRELTERDISFQESIYLQETQRHRASEFFASRPDIYFRGAAPSFLPTSPIDIRGKAGRFVVQESYALGGRVVGTLHRAGIDPKKQVKERPLETAETAIDVGLPIAARARAFVRTPSSFKFIAGESGDFTAGIGTIRKKGSKVLQPFVKTEEGFAYTAEKVGDKFKVVAQKGEQYVAKGKETFQTISGRLKEGEFAGARVSEEVAITKAKDFTGARGQSFQTGDYTYVRGGTTEGITYEGFIKTISDTKRQIGSGASKLRTRGTELASGIQRQITPPTTTKPYIPVSTFQQPQTQTPSTPPTTFKQQVPITSGGYTLGQLADPKNLQAQVGRLTVEKTDPKTKDEEIVATLPKEDIKIRGRGKSSTTTATTEATQIKEITKPVTIPAQTTRIIQRGSGRFATPFVPEFVPPFTPTKFPTFYVQRQGKVFTQPKPKKKKQPKSYTPTAFSLVTGFKGKPTFSGIKSGLGARPIRRKRKKK